MRCLRCNEIIREGEKHVSFIGTSLLQEYDIPAKFSFHEKCFKPLAYHIRRATKYK